MPTNVQVYPETEGWGVKVVGDEESEPEIFPSKEAATERGKRLAEEKGGELIVHDVRGLTEEKRSFDDGGSDGDSEGSAGGGDMPAGTNTEPTPGPGDSEGGPPVGEQPSGANPPAAH